MAFSQNRFPKAAEITVANGSTFGGDNLIDFASYWSQGGIAVSIQISNLDDSSNSIQVQFNGDSEATFTLGASQTQTFSALDLYLTSVDFANTVSGAPDIDVQVIVGLVDG